MEEIGDYRVIKVISEDSLSTIYLVTHSNSFKSQSKCYILKENKKKDNHDRENKIYKHLGKCKHIGLYYGELKVGSRRFIILEYYHQGNLYSMFPILRDITIYKRIIKQIVSALITLKNKGVIYLDLKPDNILYDHKNKEIVLIDFAHSILADEVINEKNGRGTLWYNAPEVVRDRFKLISHQTDVWSLGIVLWEMYTGDNPFAKYKDPEVRIRIANFKINKIPTNTFPQSLYNLIKSCLIDRPNDRLTIEDVKNHRFLLEK